MFEAEAEDEAKSLRLRPKFWPRGHFGFEDLTSLAVTVDSYLCLLSSGETHCKYGVT